MNTNSLPILLGALVLGGLCASLCAQSPNSAATAQESLLSTPLELNDVAAPSVPAPVSSVGAVPAADPSDGADAFVGPPLVPSNPEAVQPPAAEPVSRWAARPLPGSARAQTTDSSVPISGDGLKDALQVGGGLAVVLALLWVMRSLVRRSSGKQGGLSTTGGRSPSGVASILARYPIGRGQQVLLLGVGQRIIVAHQAAGTMQTLSEITDPDEVLALRIQINGTDRAEADGGFAAKIAQSLEAKPDGPPLEPVTGMPGLVSETIDLTRKPRGRLAGGGL